MKSIKALLLSLLVLVLVGCSKDSVTETQQVDQNPEFTGTWKLHSYNYYGSRTDIYLEDVTNTQFTGVGFEIDMNISFSENPNEFSSIGTYFVDHIVTTEAGDEYIYLGYFDVNDTGTWNRINNSISMTIDSETSQGDITELTSSSLELVIDSSTSGTAYDGTVTNITRTDVYYYTRN